jgi:ADP-ribose pyrophosphatase YjhB (NUDIX family)
MDKEAAARQFILNGYKEYLPHVSIDCAIFGYHDQQLKVLLIKPAVLEGWCLPGGYIKRGETLTQAAGRILEEKTGLADVFLQQFYTFGDPDRAKVTVADLQKFEERFKVTLTNDNWLMDHTISVGYYAIVEFNEVAPQADAFTDGWQWCDIASIPALLFDHNEMTAAALKMLQLQIYHQPIGYNLLPEKFTLPEIQVLYETILGKKLDRRNFPKRLLSLGIIERLDEQRNIGPHRAPYLYTFDKVKYDEALREGVVLAF